MRVCALILAALATTTLDWSGAAHAAAPAEQRLGHISIVSEGSGSPVVLIPGLSSPRAVWDGIAPELARSHRVIRVQVNGFGGDDAGENLKPGVLAGVVGDVHSYLAAQKLGPAKIIGHSLGGLVALQLAKAHPEDASALMIVDSLPFIADIIMPNATVAQVEPQAKAMRDQIVGSYGKPDVAGAQHTAETSVADPRRAGEGPVMGGEGGRARIRRSAVRRLCNRPAA